MNNLKDAIPYIYIRRPECPECGSFNLTTYKTIPQGDDSILRYARCECGARVKIVYEPEPSE